MVLRGHSGRTKHGIKSLRERQRAFFSVSFVRIWDVQLSPTPSLPPPGSFVPTCHDCDVHRPQPSPPRGTSLRKHAAISSIHAPRLLHFTATESSRPGGPRDPQSKGVLFSSNLTDFSFPRLGKCGTTDENWGRWLWETG